VNEKEVVAEYWICTLEISGSDKDDYFRLESPRQ